ncbi:MAG: NUDIX hydrolase [Bacilli bacterium]|nr:NUDIX hydrolase [Bacilli bacterium]
MKKANGWGDPSVTADILAHNGNKILLIRRGNYPYKNFWALPGGFMNAVDTVDKNTGNIIKKDPDINYTAAREFEEETAIKIPVDRFEQIKTYAHIFDPRCRIVDVAFSVRVNAKDMKKAIGSDDAIEALWFEIDNLPAMAFHHKQIIEDWLKKENS